MTAFLSAAAAALLASLLQAPAATPAPPPPPSPAPVIFPRAILATAMPDEVARRVLGAGAAGRRFGSMDHITFGDRTVSVLFLNEYAEPLGSDLCASRVHVFRLLPVPAAVAAGAKGRVLAQPVPFSRKISVRPAKGCGGQTGSGASSRTLDEAILAGVLRRLIRVHAVAAGTGALPFALACTDEGLGDAASKGEDRCADPRKALAALAPDSALQVSPIYAGTCPRPVFKRPEAPCPPSPSAGTHGPIEAWSIDFGYAGTGYKWAVGLAPDGETERVEVTRHKPAGD